MPETSLSRRTFCRLVAAAARLDGTPIRAAFLGTGHAHALAKILALRSRPEFELAGICRPDADGPGEGEVLQGVRWLSLDELLKDSSIQLVAGGISRPAQPQIRQAVFSTRASSFTSTKLREKICWRCGLCLQKRAGANWWGGPVAIPSGCASGDQGLRCRITGLTWIAEHF